MLQYNVLKSVLAEFKTASSIMLNILWSIEMEELSLQFFRLYYTVPGDLFPKYLDYDNLEHASNCADLLENAGYTDIQLDIVDY